jgi:Polyketide cyclase / dehydrase and lipid transport
VTTPTDIDRAAPVIAHHEIDIAASLDTVWQMHMNVNAWPTWHLEVTAAELDGAFVPGNSFTWTSYNFTVTSTIYDVVDHSRTLWGGEAQGVMGMHEWRFESTAAGVHVVTTESFSGDPVAADLPTMQTILDNSLTTWLARLKEKAESLAGEAGRQPVG